LVSSNGFSSLYSRSSNFADVTASALPLRPGF
jgi:hypothetical protein